MTIVGVTYLNGILAVLLWVIAYLVSIATESILKTFFSTNIYEKRKVIKRNLRKIKLDINDLLKECRSKGYFDISKIEYAIMEVSGNLSILPKGQYQPVVVSDLDLPASKQGLCANVIIDGKIMKNNLKMVLKDEAWLLNEMKKQGYDNYNSILLATVDINNKLTIYDRNLHTVPNNVLE